MNSIWLIITTAVLVVGEKLNYLPLVPYHKHRERVRRSLTSEFIEQNETKLDIPRRRTDAIQVGALYQGYGTHYVDLWVGTPDPQRQTLIVDTGSGVSAFPCSACKTNCGDGHHTDKVFDETKSKTFKKVSCDACKKGTCNRSGAEPFCKISMSYQEGSSWYAFEAKDQAYIGGPHDHGLSKDNGGVEDIDPNHAKAFSFEMTFGCQTRLTGLFKTQLADGIMGMDIAPTAFNKMMYAEGKVPSLEFSLCFGRQPTASRDGTEAGAMTMGGYDDRFHKSPLVFTQNTDRGGRGFYNVHIRKIYLRHGSGGESVKASDSNAIVRQLTISENQLNSGRVIVDSGTTDTYFTAAAATEYKKVFKELSGKTYGHGAEKLTEDELTALPTILIQLAGDVKQNKQLYPDPSEVPGLAHAVDEKNPYDVLIAIPPSHYMEYDDKQKAYVNRFYVDERGGGSVFGANMMMGHDVYFDEQHSRIGWSESDCDYYSIVTNNGFIDTLVPDDAKQPNKVVEKSKTTNFDEIAVSNGAVHDKGNENGNESNTKSNSVHVHPALTACSDLTCRGSLAGAMILFLTIGLLVGRRFGNSPSDYNRVSQDPNEVEMRGLVAGGFSDDPEEDNDFYNDKEVMAS